MPLVDGIAVWLVNTGRVDHDENIACVVWESTYMVGGVFSRPKAGQRKKAMLNFSSLSESGLTCELSVPSPQGTLRNLFLESLSSSTFSLTATQKILGPGK